MKKTILSTLACVLCTGLAAQPVASSATLKATTEVIESVLADLVPDFTELCLNSGGVAKTEELTDAAGFVTECTSKYRGNFRIELRVDDARIFKMLADFDRAWASEIHLTDGQIAYYEATLPMSKISSTPTRLLVTFRLPA